MVQSTSLLTLEHLSKDFPGVRALSDVSLQIREGEVHALVGENGAGKSTLIKILAGVETPNTGSRILMHGQQVALDTALEAAAAGISVIFQDFSLFPNLTVAENICFSAMTSSQKQLVDYKQMTKTAKAALDEIKLDVDPGVLVERLSIAKQQMVAIARALAMHAKLVIMDEPTSTLSTGEVEQLFRIIQQLKSNNITTIFISHKLSEVFAVSDRISVLRDGQMVGTYEKDELDEKKLIAHMVGREIVFESHVSKVESDVVLDVRHLSKKKNYKDISFQVHKGEVVCLTGLVGSGRSEVLTSVFGVQQFESGEILLNGKKLSRITPSKAKKLGMAYVPESRQTEGLVMRQDVKSNITITMLNSVKNRFGLLSVPLERKSAEAQMEKLDVRPRYPDIKTQNLSGGNQQKVVLAKWLATAPSLLLIDEPTNGIDVGAKAEIYKLIRTLADQGMAILMVSSEMTEVFSVSDNILVMRNGRIVARMHVDDADQEQIMQHALMGTIERSEESEA